MKIDNSKYKKIIMSDKFPRRAIVEELTKAEASISQSVQIV